MTRISEGKKDPGDNGNSGEFKRKGKRLRKKGSGRDHR